MRSLRTSLRRLRRRRSSRSLSLAIDITFHPVLRLRKMHPTPAQQKAGEARSGFVFANFAVLRPFSREAREKVDGATSTANSDAPLAWNAARRTDERRARLATGGGAPSCLHKTLQLGGQSGFVFALLTLQIVPLEVLRRASGPLLAMLAVALFFRFRNCVSCHTRSFEDSGPLLDDA